MTLILLLTLGLISSALIWAAGSTLEASSRRLCARYGVPALVEGSLVTAVASSLPELSSSILSTLLHGEFELGISIVVGSAIFNILVIPGLSGLRRPLDVSLALVYRDAQFYVLSIAVLLVSFSLAVIYNPLPGAGTRGTMGRSLALLPLALYGLYLLLQALDASDSERGADAEPTTETEEAPTVRGDWIRLVTGILLILAGAEGLVRTCIGLGDYFETPSFLWGVTVLAIATSAPDAIVSLQAARSGRGVVSLGNVLGSNVFDLLVVIPLGILAAGSIPFDYGVVAPLVGVLTLATIVLFTALRTGTRLTPGESWLLLVLYALFVAWMICETAGVTELLTPAPAP